MRSASRLFAFALAAAAVALFMRGRARPPETGEPCDPAAGPCEGIEPASAGGATAGARHPALASAEACRDAGYLCADLTREDVYSVMRWNEGTELIRVLVPQPPDEDPDRARRLQAAAAKGIRAWHGHPFPIRVDLSARPGDYDFVVNWSLVLGGSELGHARTQWRFQGGVAELAVMDFALATRSPFDAGRRLTPRQVELTAAHEMGHALGLPHSDDERDVMYPANTATHLTSRDYRTMEALYSLENGAQIHR